MLPKKKMFDLPLTKGKVYSPGSRIEIEKEPFLHKIKFNIFKFNNRPVPERKSNIAIFSCFSEFGSEILGSLYCIPMLMQERFLGYYSIAIGWQGREFLYSHLVDEYWELDKDYQWLRDYCRAFHHDSRNLKKVEMLLKNNGFLVGSDEFGRIALSKVFKNVPRMKKLAVFPRIKNNHKLSQMSDFIKPNLVGITARNRRCYGRNLGIDFYVKLIRILQTMGYTPIWMGEKATTHDCPVDDILDFRSSLHAGDLEKTLLLTSIMEFTIQLYTASSRLAGLVGTPFIIFESPDQIWGTGQEGLRLNLCTKGEKKLIVSHFENIKNNEEKGLNLIKQAILEMKDNNFNDIVGDVDDVDCVINLKRSNDLRIGS